MPDNNNGLIGLVIGGIVALFVIAFLVTGGGLGGKKVVEGDEDLPPVTTGVGGK